jgi:hypothetical protein
MNDRDLLAALARVLTTEEDDFVSLVRASELDPARDFIHADLRGADLRGLDLREFNFSNTRLAGARIAGAQFNETVTSIQMSEADVATRPASKVRLKLPQRFGTTADRLQYTLNFITSLRAHTLVAVDSITIDAKECQNMSASGALLLRAEIERISNENPNADIRILSPSRSMFRSMNRLLFGESAKTAAAAGQVMVSENVLPPGSPDNTVGAIQHSLSRRYGNEAFAEVVAEAIAEAVMNAVQHAYTDTSGEWVGSGRYWAATVYYRKRLFIGVVDHGVGIAASLQDSIGGAGRGSSDHMRDARLELAPSAIGCHIPPCGQRVSTSAQRRFELRSTPIWRWYSAHGARPKTERVLSRNTRGVRNFAAHTQSRRREYC